MIYEIDSSLANLQTELKSHQFFGYEDGKIYKQSKVAKNLVNTFFYLGCDRPQLQN